MRAVSKFIQGFDRCQALYLGERRELYDRLVVEGQRPPALVIACSDSRCDPALLTDCELGDMFVVRCVANLVPPYARGEGYAGVSSAIEFGVRRLGVEHVIVLGHSQCGGISALIGTAPEQHESEFLGRWLGIAAPVRDRVLHDLADKPRELQARACEQASILVSLENLASYPWIRERLAQGTMALHGWYFDMAARRLMCYSSQTRQFEPLAGIQTD